MKPANQTVAVVDDEDNLRETLAFALRREGYPVELFARGAEAWGAFQRRLPGLVPVSSPAEMIRLVTP